MSNKNNGITISFPSTLFIVFLVLKLTNTIDWSWWWVLAPLWMPFGIFIVIVIILFIIKFIIWDY